MADLSQRARAESELARAKEILDAATRNFALAEDQLIKAARAYGAAHNEYFRTLAAQKKEMGT